MRSPFSTILLRQEDVIMGNYAEKNLVKGEQIVKVANRNGLALLSIWIKGILFCWVLLIPLIKAIINTIKFFKTELTLTTKRVVGKEGVVNVKALDAPVNKVQNISTKQGFWGKIFNYSDIQINTAAGTFVFSYIKNADAFKGAIIQQSDIIEEERIKQQASEMAAAMAGVMNR